MPKDMLPTYVKSGQEVKLKSPCNGSFTETRVKNNEYVYTGPLYKPAAAFGPFLLSSRQCLQGKEGGALCQILGGGGIHQTDKNLLPQNPDTTGTHQKVTHKT